MKRKSANEIVENNFMTKGKKKLAHLTRNDKNKNESKKRFLDKSAVLLLVQLNT